MITHWCKLLFLSTGLLCCTSCQDGQQISVKKLFYPDGKLKVAATLQGQQLHGRTTRYYPSGAIESIAEWSKGKRTGLTRFYYPNGRLRDSSLFTHDTLTGAWRYYRNGILQEVQQHAKDRPFVCTVLFDSTGKRTESHTYDLHGEHLYMQTYDSEGHADAGHLSPILEVRDTIAWGEKYQGSIRFGYSLTNKATLLVGRRLGLDRKAADRYPLLDTVLVVPQSPDGRFYFAYLPTRSGINTFAYKFLQPGSPWDALPKDSLSVDQLSSSHRFLVRKPIHE
ncbi:toxin-antitoxin system YwqK family antitoxin [Hymenobacter defluvii]|uniref:toxin-antitoxin system YwqK family antitoxin n=1 Tax=Hymenobacter defluvii TaxID=2054411 RepID=UPI001AAF0C40|nr:hypothetical protein [Hymenobacter defluvii]